MTETTSLLDAALTYAARGWHVFPCHTPTPDGCSCSKREACTDIGKHPRWSDDTQHGLQDATTSEATIRRWWKQWPTANVAIRTGALSGLVVLDRDDPKGGADSLEALEHTYQPLPETILSLTGHGQHYLFSHPGRHVKNGVETLGTGLDLRGDGGYIIAPPSLHASGRSYAWEILHEPDDTPLAPMPAWLLALCQTPTRSEAVDAGAPIPDGQRNDTLFRVGCSFRAKGCSEAVMLAALRAMNATQCQPPLRDADVQKIVGSIAQYEVGALDRDLAQYRNGSPPGPVPPPALITICAADVTPARVEWLWDLYIALGTICMLDGDPGIGKSLLVLQLAANISRGLPFPDQTGKPTVGASTPANVLIMTREDSLAKTIRPRLDASGADVQRVFISANWLDATGKEQTFTLKHLPLLEAEVQRLAPRLVVLDPIQSFFGDIDMHRANQTRPLLDALAALADTYGCAIVCIRHPAKPGEGIGKALHRGLGSVDIIGAARTGLFIEQYPGDDTQALLCQTKSNLGLKGRTQIFSKQEGVFTWVRASRLTDEDLAGSGRGPNHRAFLEAVLWLERRLEGGFACNATDIEGETELQDLSSSLLRRAKKALGVVSAQLKGEAHAGWTWRLPPLRVATSPTPPTDSSELTDTTDTTDTPDLQTKTYEGEVVRASVASEGSEGSDVSVDGVVTGVGTPPGRAHAPPPQPCPGCQKPTTWLIRGTEYVCYRETCKTVVPQTAQAMPR